MVDVSMLVLLVAVAGFSEMSLPVSGLQQTRLLPTLA
jgi:hypothetical protein